MNLPPWTVRPGAPSRLSTWGRGKWHIRYLPAVSLPSRRVNRPDGIGEILPGLEVATLVAFPTRERAERELRAMQAAHDRDPATFHAPHDYWIERRTTEGDDDE